EALARGDEARATKLKQVKQYWETVTSLMAQGVSLIDAETVATRQLDIENQKLAKNIPAPPRPTHFDISGKPTINPADTRALSTPAPHTDFNKEFSPHINTSPGMTH